MNISNLNVRITIQKNAVVIDKIGNHTNEWQDYYSCYATVSGETGTEQAIVGETVENVEICFSVRYCEKNIFDYLDKIQNNLPKRDLRHYGCESFFIYKEILEIQVQEI